MTTSRRKKLTHPPIPPSTTLLPLDTDLWTCHWFHGTRSSQLEAILRNGLAPRAGSLHVGNWEHPSRDDMVYLSTAYGMYYAKASGDPGFCAVLELDVTALDPSRLFADEDSYALSTVTDMPHLNALSVAERVAYWREHLEETSAEVSLRVLGNCTYKGVIPPSAVKAVRLLTEKEANVLTFRAHDPVIAPANFRLMGGGHQMFHKWLLGHETQLNSWLDSLQSLSIPLMSLSEAVDYHRSHWKE